MPTSEEQKAANREAMRRHRAKRKAEGWQPPASTPEQRAANAAKAKEYRARARAEGRKAKSELWWQDNRAKHRENVRRWREANPEKAAQITRSNQAARRSTPWGKINNRLWATIHTGVRAATGRSNVYSNALGYTWADLRAHLEAQFTVDMSWDNWGDVWELDHIEPLSAFQYVDLLDPLFKQAWRLENLRPLHKHLNQKKGSKREP